MEIVVENLEQTKELAEKFADLILEHGAFVCLFGDVGAGKTAFTRFVFKKLGVKEKITSPSFVILNEYHSGAIPCYHFDLYRLEKEGAQSMKEELREYSTGKILTMVEWAQFSDVCNEFEKIDVNFAYLDENKRKLEFSANTNQNQNLLKELFSCIS